MQAVSQSQATARQEATGAETGEAPFSENQSETSRRLGSDANGLPFHLHALIQVHGFLHSGARREKQIVHETEC